MDKDTEEFFIELDNLRVGYDEELYEGIWDKTIKKTGLKKLMKECDPLIDKIDKDLQTLNNLLGDYIVKNKK